MAHALFIEYDSDLFHIQNFNFLKDFSVADSTVMPDCFFSDQLIIVHNALKKQADILIPILQMVNEA